jgi:hypothetical protein
VGQADVGEAESNRSLHSTFVTTTGGVMTDEVGAITGELELLTRVSQDGGIKVLVRYAGARDLYTVSGSPVHTVSEHPDQVEHRAAHERILEALTTPGRIESGNELPVDLLAG